MCGQFPDVQQQIQFNERLQIKSQEYVGTYIFASYKNIVHSKELNIFTS